MPAAFASRLAGVAFRHSRLSDAPAIMRLFRLRDVAEEGLAPPALLRAAGVGTAEDIVDLIQTSFIAITATAHLPTGENNVETAGRTAAASTAATAETVVGFFAVATGPRLECGRVQALSAAPAVLPASCWEALLHCGLYADDDLDHVWPSTALWATLFAAPALSTIMSTTGTDRIRPVGHYSAGRLLREMLTVVLGHSPHTSHVIFALPSAASDGGNGGGGCTASMEAVAQLLREELHATVVQPALSSSVRPPGFNFTGTLLHVRRTRVLPPLLVRAGRIEDYDDFAPLLVEGDGVITALPDDFFLEELLKDQDAQHKVGVAEDPVTHAVVGLVCAHALSAEEQQAFTKQYALEPFNRLRQPALCGVGAPSGSTAVRLDFVYYSRAYDGAAHELIHHVFDELFPTCEYVLVTLPHAQAEASLLRGFSYVPMRQYQPHNSRGELAPAPLGLWVCCRQSAGSAETFRVVAVRAGNEHTAVKEFLSLPSLPDLSRGLADTLRAELRAAMSDAAEQHTAKSANVESGGHATGTVSPPPLLRLMRGAAMIGVVSVRRMTPHDLYALRANYDLDAYLSLYTHTGHDYSASGDDFDASATESRLPPELNGVLVRAMYVRPAFRTWVRFFIREVLRQHGADVAVALTEAGDEPYAPLLQEMVSAPPRRVTEKVHVEGGAAENLVEMRGEAGGADADSTNAVSAVAAMSVPGSVAALAALHFTTSRFLADEKARVHARVVVVGASATGLALLHSLVTTPFAHLTNLVLISTDGLPPHPNAETALWRADHLELREREYLALQQGSPVRIVSGSLVDLDKVHRFVSVDNGTFEPYDILILATGRQYVQPPSVRQLLVQEGRTGKKAIVALNGDLALDRVRQALATMEANQGSVANVMIYGSGLDALAVAAAMTQEGFSPQRLVVCAREEGLPPGMDAPTYHATAMLFRSLGISIFRGYDVGRLEFDDENHLTSVLLTPVSANSRAGQAVELACSLMACVDDKDISPSVLSALTKRSIVFDGRVIVNHRYRTTDRHVLAAGPVAMWTRRYGTVTANFEDFHAGDIGAHLAKVVLSRLGFEEQLRCATGVVTNGEADDTGAMGDAAVDDDLSEDNDGGHGGGADGGALVSGTATGSVASERAASGNDAATLRKRLPTYATPIARRVRLPNGYHFFSAQRVGGSLGESCETLTCDTVDPDEFTTHSAPSSPALAAMDAGDESLPSAAVPSQRVGAEGRVNEEGSSQSVLTLYVNRSTRCIDAATYFGREEPPTGNYSALIGLPETVLNLLFRYREAERRVETFLTSPAAPAGLTAKQVNLPPYSGLTAGIRGGSLDLIRYLQLPHLQTVLYDRFTSFFRRLASRVAAHEEAVRMRERIIAEHRLDRTLSPDEIAAYQRELTAKKSTFAYEVQLALLAFLHEHKNAQPRTLFLPNVERAVAMRRGRDGVPGSGGVLDPVMMAR